MTRLAAGAALAGAVLVAFPGGAQAETGPYVPPADELAEAGVIIAAMFPEDRREQIVLDMAMTTGNQAAAGFMKGPVFEEPGIRAVVDRYLAEMPDAFRTLFAEHLPRIFEATAIAYTREFTLEELKDISAFARTPSGQRYFISLQKFPNDPAVAAANQAMFASLAPIQQEMVGRLRQELEEYLVANPEVVERLSKTTGSK